VLKVVKQTDQDHMSLSVSQCPECKCKMHTADSRLYLNFGFPTIRRRRYCDKCEFRVTTIEIPFNMAKDIFNEED
jgi:transcriptional regulator NrdR family protein